MVKQGLTGSGYGLNSWLFQKITALIILIVIFLAVLISAILMFQSNTSHMSVWQELFSYTLTRTIIQIFCLALIINIWVSMRDVWMDYISATWLRLIFHTLTLLWLLGCLIYSVKILWL